MDSAHSSPPGGECCDRPGGARQPRVNPERPWNCRPHLVSGYLPQHALYFLPLPQGQGSLRPTRGVARTGRVFSNTSAASDTTLLASPTGWEFEFEELSAGSPNAAAV